MGDLKSFGERTKQLWNLGDALRRQVVAAVRLPDSFGAFDDPRSDSFGAQLSFREKGPYIRVQLGTFLYLLEEVPQAFRAGHVSYCAQGTAGAQELRRVDQEACADRFALAVAAAAFSVLIGHELCHLMNGHFYLKNPLMSSEPAVLADAQRLRQNEATAFALEMNADLAGVNFTIGALMDLAAGLHQLLQASEECLPGIASAAGIGSLLAFAVVVLAKTWRASTVCPATHPKPSFRFAAVKKAVLAALQLRERDVELQAFLAMLPEAMVQLAGLRLSAVEFSHDDALQDGYSDMPVRIEQAWRDSESFLNGQKAGGILCFDEEMHDWTKALRW